MKEETKKLKMAIISGAAHAIRHKMRNPRATEEEVIRHVTDQAKEILEKIDEEI